MVNFWEKPANIDAMSSNEWLDYRDQLLEEFYKRGYVLKPDPSCSCCDLSEDYTCFGCEVNQIEKARGNNENIA